MSGDRNTIGTCSLCGGRVTTPRVWMATTPPPTTCERCGAEPDTRRTLPVIPMKRRHREAVSTEWVLPLRTGPEDPEDPWPVVTFGGGDR